MRESSIRVNLQRTLGAISRIVYVKKLCKDTEFCRKNSVSPILATVAFFGGQIEESLIDH